MWAAGCLLKRVTFFLPRLSGQDPIRERMIKLARSGSAWAKGIEDMVELYNEKFGLDKPLWQQYLTCLGDMARFELGHSIASYPRTVKQILPESMQSTISLLTVMTLL